LSEQGGANGSDGPGNIDDRLLCRGRSCEPSQGRAAVRDDGTRNAVQCRREETDAPGAMIYSSVGTDHKLHLYGLDLSDTASPPRWTAAIRPRISQTIRSDPIGPSVVAGSAQVSAFDGTTLDSVNEGRFLYNSGLYSPAVPQVHLGAARTLEIRGAKDFSSDGGASLIAVVDLSRAVILPVEIAATTIAPLL
jgi:hypothetical protein